MLLYDVSYWSLKTRTRNAGCDNDVPIERLKAPKGELCCCTCTNGERETIWIDENGDVVPEPGWHARR